MSRSHLFSMSQRVFLTLLALAAGFSNPSSLLAADEKETEATRQKWQGRIQFFGEEESNKFSLRIFDKDAKEEGKFVFLEVWKFDREKKEWVKMDAARRETKAVPANQKPKESPEDSQILVELPINIQDVGLYYAKWTIDGIPCANYMRLGPRSTTRTSPGKAPPGSKVEDVPLNVNKAELMIIPDPIYHTGEGSKPIPGKKKA